MRSGSSVVSVTLEELLLLSRNAREISFGNFISSCRRSGQHHSRLFGRGMEFAESRRYHAGDESRNIDWRVTARTGKAHTKLFAAEKERQVHLLVDMRSSMFFATRGVFKAVQAALMAGTIAWNSVLTGNRLGGVIFDDADYFEFRPALGKRGVLPFLQKLADMFTTKKENKLAHAPMDAAIDHLKRVVESGSLVVVLSDFRHFSDSSKNKLMELARHSDLRLAFFYDPIEVSLPKNGLYPVTDGDQSVQVSTYEKASLEKYRHHFVERKSRVTSMGDYIECKTDDDYLTLLRS